MTILSDWFHKVVRVEAVVRELEKEMPSGCADPECSATYCTNMQFARSEAIRIVRALAAKGKGRARK